MAADPMQGLRRLHLLLLHLLLLLLHGAHSIAEDRCNYLYHKYLIQQHKPPVPLEEAQLLYFLHIPRTAGRSFFFCFLKRGTPVTKRCPKSYDHLRVDTHVPDCWLLSSHDDYSIIPMLSAKVAVVTQLRNPVDRIISAYEFAIEIACREKRRVQLNQRQKTRQADRTLTTQVWPWSYLTPYMLSDMLQKVEVLRSQQAAQRQLYVNASIANTSRRSLTSLPQLDAYNNSLVVSLHDFVQSPIAHELLHNGAFFQLLGLTNYSHFSDANELRQCVMEHASIREDMMKLAKEYLSKFAHVGTTDLLYESVAAAGASLNMPVNGPSFTSNLDIADIPKNIRHMPLPGLNPKRSLLGPEAGNSSSTWPTTAPSKADADSLSGGGGSSSNRSSNVVSLLRQLQGWLRAARMQASHMMAAGRRAAWYRIGAPLAARWAALRGSQDGLDWQQLQRHLQQADGTATPVVTPAVGGNNAGLARAPNHSLGAQSLTGPAQRLARESARRGLPLGREFASCTEKRQEKGDEARRRGMLNLKDAEGRGVVFSKLARKSISPETMELMRKLNALDTELYEYGKQLLLDRRKQHFEAGRLRELPPRPPKGGPKAPMTGTGVPVTTPQVFAPVPNVSQEAGTTGNGEL